MSFTPSKKAWAPSLKARTATKSGYFATNIPQTGHLSLGPGFTASSPCAQRSGAYSKSSPATMMRNRRFIYLPHSQVGLILIRLFHLSHFSSFADHFRVFVHVFIGGLHGVI